MKSPAFQFYPGDWRRSANLRRCSIAARGAWLEILCLMHDSAEYGVLRWPLVEIARAAGVPLKLARELVAKGVLKGADKGATEFIHRPRHAGKDGAPIEILSRSSDSPLWYSSRMLVDEYNRNVRGGNTRFSSKAQPSPIRQPTRADGERKGTPKGNGASSAVALDLSKSSGSLKQPMPVDKSPSETMRSIAETLKASPLKETLERIAKDNGNGTHKPEPLTGFAEQAPSTATQHDEITPPGSLDDQAQALGMERMAFELDEDLVIRIQARRNLS